MMKKNYLLKAVAVVSAIMLSVGFMSCGGDDGGDNSAPVTLSISGVDAPFAADAASMSSAQELTIKCNSSWGITSKPDWIDIDRQNGSGDASVKVWPNKTNSASTEERSGKIIIQAGDKEVVKTVYQRAGVDSELFVSPNEIVTLADGFAFDFSFGSKVKYYYVARYLSSAMARKTDAEIIAEMSSDTSNRDTPSDGYVTSWQNQSPLTEYVICTVGFDSNGKNGALSKTTVKTKSGTNQAVATISDVTYDNTYWYWTTGVNGFVTKYYMWFVTNTNLYSTTDAAIAWFFKQAMKQNPDNFAPIAQGDSWQATRNGGSIFHVVTWALDVDGNYSGLIDRFRGSISSSSSQKMPNFVEDFDSSKRYKTIK